LSTGVAKGAGGGESANVLIFDIPDNIPFETIGLRKVNDRIAFALRTRPIQTQLRRRRILFRTDGGASLSLPGISSSADQRATHQSNYDLKSISAARI
jgi:hypothetical protein